MIFDTVNSEQASENTKLHALYAYYYVGLRKNVIAEYFGKSPSTISNWISRYDETGNVNRAPRVNIFIKYHKLERDWINKYIQSSPLSYLNEIRTAFISEFLRDISLTSIFLILKSFGLTRKVIERRAIQIREADIIRFANELNSLDWMNSSLIFLDEVSFDNRGLFRNYGYSLKGSKVVVTGEFRRKARISLLCFISSCGVRECFYTEGTFDRQKFFKNCQDFALNSNSSRQYPGKNSIWILDGAKIHCHPSITTYLRSVGIVPIFLPAYCPFFNPIEILFGLVKAKLRTNESTSFKSLEIAIATALISFRNYDTNSLYEHCGYFNGVFNPGKNFK